MLLIVDEKQCVICVIKTTKDVKKVVSSSAFDGEKKQPQKILEIQFLIIKQLEQQQQQRLLRNHEGISVANYSCTV